MEHPYSFNRSEGFTDRPQEANGKGEEELRRLREKRQRDERRADIQRQLKRQKEKTAEAEKQRGKMEAALGRANPEFKIKQEELARMQEERQEREKKQEDWAEVRRREREQAQEEKEEEPDGEAARPATKTWWKWPSKGGGKRTRRKRTRRNRRRNRSRKSKRSRRIRTKRSRRRRRTKRYRGGVKTYKTVKIPRKYVTKIGLETGAHKVERRKRLNEAIKDALHDYNAARGKVMDLGYTDFDWEHMRREKAKLAHLRKKAMALLMRKRAEDPPSTTWFNPITRHLDYMGDQ